MRTSKQRFNIRKNRVRSKIRKVSDRLRLSVFKSGRHIYAQIINDSISETVVSASSLDKEIRQLNKSNCNLLAAEKVGKLIASRASKHGVNTVIFDRGGYKYHGRIKVLADAARESLSF